MSYPRPHPKDEEDAAAAQALAAAIAESDADPRIAPHKEVRAWLLRVANGECVAPPPEARRGRVGVWRVQTLANFDQTTRHLPAE